jgi:hypothetical protein
MADRWYYVHGDSKQGPCTGQQLKELAAAGQILPTDTVWKEGIEKGVPARKVRYLFAASQAEAAAPLAEAPPAPLGATAEPESSRAANIAATARGRGEPHPRGRPT